ncbi:transcriptional regulator [Mycoplasmopsis californica]|uniref:Transcriptional regulator n=1 Tax=Mycoplasmopsis californica TaxID=2113 RepID=A0A059XWX1_9BACT|nr:LacI family DNA-binding transcriptional regulator [Mycoplasmopsis californica]AIA29781.1 transcriptional regulator [Mycoplasmopsis californica]
MRSFSYKDISKLAKVSISTVSRYYNAGYVSKKTRAKIEKVVKENGYYPNNGARLIKGRSSSIFVIAPKVYDHSVSHIINGIETSAETHQKKVFITHSEPTAIQYIETIRWCMAWKPNAIVFFLPKGDNTEIINFIKDQDLSITTVAFGDPIKGMNYVEVDVLNAFFSVTKMFYNYIENGQKVVYADDLKLSQYQRESRFLGFKKACEELNIEYERYFIDNHKNSDVQKFQKYLFDQNHVNVVCSTHESFINLVSSNDNQLRLTDIGTHSIYDTQKKYKSKILIDYRKVGAAIEKIIFDAELKKQDKPNAYLEPVSVSVKPTVLSQKQV